MRRIIALSCILLVVSATLADNMLMANDRSDTALGEISDIPTSIRDDMGNPIAYAASADTWISDIQTVFTDSGSGYRLVPYMDSAYVIHPSILSNSEGFFGSQYGRMMAYTPFPDSDADNENIHVSWSCDDNHWTHILDSTSGDSVINPIYKAEDFGCIHLSDPDLYVDYSGNTRVIFRLTYHDSIVLKDGYSTDGINWSEPTTIMVDSVGDTLNTPRAYNVRGHLMSPSVLYLDGLYHMWCVNKYDTSIIDPTWDTCMVLHLTSSSPTGGWSIQDSVCAGLFAYDNTDYSIYHVEMSQREDELITWAVCKDRSSGTDHKIIMGLSYDNGSSWKMIDTTGSAWSILHADSAGWDGLSLYRASGYWSDEVKTHFRLFYTGRTVTYGPPAVIDAWHTGHTDVRFILPGDANRDGMMNISDVIYLINCIFKVGPMPSPIYLGDVNADCDINVGDAVFMIRYIFMNGEPPQIGCAGW